MENKIKQILHRMVEKRHKEYPKEVFKISLMDVIRTQVYHGRIDPDDVMDMEKYADMLLDEFYYEDLYEPEEDEEDV